MNEKNDREIMQQDIPRNQCGEACERAKLCAVCLAEMTKQPEQEPVAGVVIREGLPTLLQDKHIKSTDQRLYTAPQKREWQRLTDEEKLIDLLEAARETFKKSPSGSECSQNAAYVHSVLETMLIKREWQGLTDEEISAIIKSIPGETVIGALMRLLARQIEAKLKEKNT